MRLSFAAGRQYKRGSIQSEVICVFDASWRSLFRSGTAQVVAARTNGDEDLFFTSGQLEAVDEWRQDVKLDDLEKRFLEASRRKRISDSQREIERLQQIADAEARKQQAESQRANDAIKFIKRLKQAVAGIAILASIAIIVGVWAFIQKKKANSLAISEGIAKSDAVQSAQEANRQAANAYWQIALTARDRASDPIKATHNFILAAQSLFNAGEVTHGRHVQLAADVLARRIVSLPCKSQPVFNSDESLAVFCEANAAEIWDMRMRTRLRVLPHDDVQGARFSHDGKRLVTWDGKFLDNDDTVANAKIWNVSDGVMVLTFPLGKPTFSVQFSPDDSHLLATNFEDSAKIWKIGNPKPIQILRHPEEGQFHFLRAHFSRDGQRVLTACANGTVKLWNLNVPEPIQTFVHASRGVEDAIFDAKESRILTWGCLKV